MVELLRHPRWRILALLAALFHSAGCGNDADVARVDRETFVSVWVELRLAALASPGGRVDPETRERLVARHGTTEEELLAFVEAHARDIAYMERVWEDVEERMNELSAAADTAGG